MIKYETSKTKFYDEQAYPTIAKIKQYFKIH